LKRKWELSDITALVSFAERDGQVVHVGEVGLAEPARLMDLLKDNRILYELYVGEFPGNRARKMARLEPLMH
jgi:hypothetical protein